MIFDEYFDRVVILSLNNEEGKKRSERAIRELKDKNLSQNAIVYRAVDGRICRPPDWWPAGQGAWGCLQSHNRMVQDALQDQCKSILIIEDDAIWQSNAYDLAKQVLEELPDDWGQLYLGGQHRGAFGPTKIPGKDSIVVANSIHRTHCYALNAKIMRKFLKHIMDFPEYSRAFKESDQRRHIDHQLEEAHRNKLWKTYASSWWLAGQGENKSHINLKENTDKWWHFVWEDNHRGIPIIIMDRTPTNHELKYLHFGYNLTEEDQTIDIGVSGAKDAKALNRAIEFIAIEGYKLQRFPCVNVNDNKDKIGWINGFWKAGVINLSSGPDLEKMSDFVNSKIINHYWINPPKVLSDVFYLDESEFEIIPNKTIHQISLDSNHYRDDLKFCSESVKTCFFQNPYKLWQERDILHGLVGKSIAPEVIINKDNYYSPEVRSAFIKLEILRQFGGLVLDLDIAIYKPEISQIFNGDKFIYSDSDIGKCSNSIMYARKNNLLVELYLRRMSVQLLDNGDVDPIKSMRESLDFYVNKWNVESTLEISGQLVGNIYKNGNVVFLPHQSFFPYQRKTDSMETFKLENYTKAFAAKHWRI